MKLRWLAYNIGGSRENYFLQYASNSRYTPTYYVITEHPDGFQVMCHGSELQKFQTLSDAKAYAVVSFRMGGTP